MGRRSRKRVRSGEAPRRPPSPEPARPSRRDEAPRAPWHPFPLVELSVLVALVVGVLGLVKGGEEGVLLLACAAALGSLAGLEVSIREHLGGYRSHTTVLAGALAVMAAAVLYFARAPWIVITPGTILLFAGGFWFLRHVFRRRSGGVSVR